MCLIHEEGQKLYALCFSYMIKDRSNMRLLHEEGQKLYALCVCYMRKNRSNMGYVSVT